MFALDEVWPLLFFNWPETLPQSLGPLVISGPDVQALWDREKGTDTTAAQT